MVLFTPKPENVKIKGATFVSSDLYDIAKRVMALDPRLFIVYHQDQREPYVVMERCDDGVDRFVKRFETLDARVLDALRYMLAVPFEERVKQIDKENKAANDAHDRISEEQFEKFAFEFDRAARRSNMYDPIWVKNMPLKKARA